MPGIITDVLKNLIIDDLLADVDNVDNSYYIAFGRSEDWDSADATPTPVNCTHEIRRMQNTMQSVKKIDDYVTVIPRHNWSSGTVYSAYDDRVGGHPENSFYVMTDDSQVYLCLRQGKNDAGQITASTVKPTGVADTAFETGDGYVWKFCYSIGSNDNARFLAANFMPVRYIDSADGNSPIAEQQQKSIQDAAIPGQIVGYEVISGGSGYTSAPTITVKGDGTNAKGSATIFGGTISKVELYDSSGELTTGSGYTNATVSVTGGGGANAVVRPIIAKDGLGADPTKDLRATALMFNVKPTGTEAGDFVVNNDFRQVSIIRNPKVGGPSDSDFTDLTGSALYNLKLNSISQPFSRDKIILGSNSGAMAYIDDLDSDSLWYHQTEETGFTLFEEGETISETNGSGVGSLELAGVDGDDNAFTYPEVDPRSGDVLYIANRAAITRSADQTEDIKIVIQF